MRRTGWFLLALVALFSGCSAGDGGASRRRVVVYSPHGDDILRDCKERFEAANPEIEVVHFDMGSGDVLNRLQGEKASPQADIWWGAPAAIFMRGAKADLLAPYTPSWAAAVNTSEHDSTELWYGVFQQPIVLGYNRDVTRPETLPSSWDEVIDPRYRGQIVIRHPLASGTMTTLFTAKMFQSLRDTGSVDAGLQWLLALDANTASYEPSPQAMYDAVARDPRGRWTFWELPDLIYQSTMSADPIPFGYKVLAGETPVIVDCIALVKGGRNPSDAKLYYEFVTTPESLAFLYARHKKMALRRDLPDAAPETTASGAVVPPLARNWTPLALDWAVLAEHSAEWMNRWDLEVENHGLKAQESSK